jgi:hypothetical protein
MAEHRKRLPVIIGVARVTERKLESTPSAFLSNVLQLALADAVVGADPNAKAALGSALSDVVTVRMAVEDAFKAGTNCEPYKNLAQQITKMAGVDSDKQRYYATSSGGSTPQMLVNVFSERIARGESECVAMVGGEVLEAFRHQMMTLKSRPDWGAKHEESLVTNPVEAVLGKYAGDDVGVNEVESKNGLLRPAQMYPMLEQANRFERGYSVQENNERNGKIFERFNEVAATKESKLAWFPKRRTAKEITTEATSNRWVSFPYTKSVLYSSSRLQSN